MIDKSYLLLLGFFIVLPGVHPGRLTSAENQKVQQNCGKAIDVQKKILGGEEISSSEEMMRESPWVVSILAKGKMGCSGVLISPRHVLTAAHCMGFQPRMTICRPNYRHSSMWNNLVQDFTVRIYSKYAVNTNKSEKIDKKLTLVSKVKRIMFPQSYTEENESKTLYKMCSSWNNDTEDIAIFELRNPVKRPLYACIANFERSRLNLSNVYGFGSTGLDNVAAEPYKLKTLEVMYGQHHSPDGERTFNGMKFVKPKFSKTSTSCPGDSGGPIISIESGRKTIVGILAEGPDCIKVRNGQHTQPIENVITSVSYYLNWICTHSGVCPAGATDHDPRPTFDFK